MFPLRDDNPTEMTPVVTVVLILLNVLAWIYLQGAGADADTLVRSVCAFGAIPAELTGAADGYRGVDLGDGQVCEFGGGTWSTLVSAMFLHGGWLHLIGNMWFLWLFGNNVEDSMGRLRYIVFYLLVGFAASAGHVYAEPESPLPMVGASGAISGVMGAYLVLYPKVRIHTLFIVLIFIKIIPVSAWLILLYWFFIQVFSGLAGPAAQGGVAFWAHAGGFVAGLLAVKIFENRTLVEAKRHKIQLSPYEIENRGWW